MQKGYLKLDSSSTNVFKSMNINYFALSAWAKSVCAEKHVKMNEFDNQYILTTLFEHSKCACLQKF